MTFDGDVEFARYNGREFSISVIIILSKVICMRFSSNCTGISPSLTTSEVNPAQTQIIFIYTRVYTTHVCVMLRNSRSSFPLNLSNIFSAKYFEFETIEQTLYRWWESEKHFTPAASSTNEEKFVIPMPPPNVTGHLHMGHAMFVSIEDSMTRYHRMKGFDTLWLPGMANPLILWLLSIGTDHAGIATQLMLEKDLAKSGLTREQLGREKFMEKAWEWKESQGRYIVNQVRTNIENNEFSNTDLKD